MSDEELPYGEVLERIASLAEKLTEGPDPAVSSAVSELLDWVDAFHRDGLGRLVDMIRAWRGEIFLDSVAEDPICGVLLDAYGLGEGKEVQRDAAAMVEEAMGDVRPMVESHGGSIEVESIVDGVVSVRLAGTCDGCPSSDATLTYGVEAALREHWPHFRRLEVLDPAPEADPARGSLTCGIPAPEGAIPAGAARGAGGVPAEPKSVPVALGKRKAK